MKVKELIERLSKCDTETEVRFRLVNQNSLMTFPVMSVISMSEIDLATEEKNRRDSVELSNDGVLR